MKSKLIGWLTVVPLVALMISIGVSVTGYKRAEGAEAKKIKLVYWHKIHDLETPEGEWLLEAKAEYEKKYPNVNLILETPPPNEMAVMMQTAAAAHRGADIVTYWEGVYCFALEEYIVDAKEYLTPEDLEKFVPEVLITGYYDYDKSKKLLGVPYYGGGIYNMIYNKGMFKEAGISPPTEATDYRMSWEEFKNACDKLLAVGITPLGWGNKGGNMSCWWWASFLLQTFEEDDWIRLYKGDMAWNDPKIEEAFSRVNELYQAGYFNEGGLTLGWTEGLNLMRNRDVAMQSVFWGLSSKLVYEELGDDFGMMKDPVFNPDGPLTYTVMGGVPNKYMIPTWSEYQEEGAEWIRLISSKEQQEKIFEMTGRFPALVEWDTSLIENQWDQLAYKWMNEKNLQPNYDNTSVPTEIFYEAASLSIELFTGKITVQELGDKVQERFEQLDWSWITGKAGS